MLQKRAGARAGECVVFDLDGTLVDSVNTWSQLRAKLRESGI